MQFCYNEIEIKIWKHPQWWHSKEDTSEKAKI